MRIALLSPGIFPYVVGGIQKHSFNLAKHLAILGIKVDLYHTDFSDAVDIDQLDGMTNAEKENITSIAISWSKRDPFPGHYIRSLQHFSTKLYHQYCQRPPADFIYGQSLTAFSFIKAKRHGEKLPPIGVNLHGYEMFQLPASWKSYLQNQIVLQSPFRRHALEANYVFSLGGKLTELIQDELNIQAEKIIEIPGGIDSSWLVDQIKTASRPIRFIFVGRCERRKGIQELQTAICTHPIWKSRAQFRFIGPIPEDKRLSMPHVSYAGAIRDETLLKHELSQADVLICPSHSEGMPTVILEGMASGLAILATDVGAVRLLVDSKNGVLLPKVSIPSIIQGVDRLLDQSENQLKKMKQTSLDRVQSFTWDRIAACTLDEIQKIIVKV
ncbi:MAG: glycosyltransferase family 4 protein [Cyanobacteria bacterium P01_D01_bin.156]